MYQNILVPLDSSQTSHRGLQEAIALARTLSARMLLLHVIDALPTLVKMSADLDEGSIRQNLQQDAQSLLTNARNEAAQHEVEAEFVIRQVTGSGIASAVVEEAERHRCDLIVMGTHGRKGIGHMVLGSDAEAVVRRSSVPVLLVRNPE